MREGELEGEEVDTKAVSGAIRVSGAVRREEERARMRITGTQLTMVARPRLFQEEEGRER